MLYPLPLWLEGNFPGCGASQVFAKRKPWRRRRHAVRIRGDGADNGHGLPPEQRPVLRTSSQRQKQRRTDPKATPNRQRPSGSCLDWKMLVSREIAEKSKVDFKRARGRGENPRRGGASVKARRSRPTFDDPSASGHRDLINLAGCPQSIGPGLSLAEPWP